MLLFSEVSLLVTHVSFREYSRLPLFIDLLIGSFFLVPSSNIFTSSPKALLYNYFIKSASLPTFTMYKSIALYSPNFSHLHYTFVISNLPQSLSKSHIVRKQIVDGMLKFYTQAILKNVL